VKTLRLLSYNIRYGGIGREDALASTIAACEPDLVLLQEATDAGTVHRVAERSRMGQWATFKRQSLGFLSREPVEHFEWHQPRFSRHAFLDIVPAGTSARFFGVHLSAVHAAWTERRRLFEIRALLRSVERHKSGFHVLTPSAISTRAIPATPSPPRIHTSGSITSSCRAGLRIA
jgi:endonuclease/exonuclease/phosphatase family metal-dependent hydrolase